MPEAQSIPFSVIPGTPTRVQVKDPQGKGWEVLTQVVVAAVRSPGTKDPITGIPVFEFDIQVSAQTKPMEVK